MRNLLRPLLVLVAALTGLSVAGAADRAVHDPNADLVHVGSFGRLATAPIPPFYFGTPAFDPATNRYYVATFPGNRVDVIAARSGDLATSIDIPQPGPGFETVAVALDAGRRRLYVAQGSFDVMNLNVVDADDYSLLETILFPQSFAHTVLTLNPSNGQLFVLGAYGASVFDPTKAPTDPTRVRPIGFNSAESVWIQPTIDPTHHLMWVSLYCSTAVIDVDPASAGFGYAIVNLAHVVGPYALDRAGGRVYAQRCPALEMQTQLQLGPPALLELNADRSSPSFATISSVIELSSIPPGDPPRDSGAFAVAMAISPARGSLYVQLFSGNNLWYSDSSGPGLVLSVDLESFTVADALPIPYETSRFCCDPQMFSHSVVDRIHVKGNYAFEIYSDARPTQVTVPDDGVVSPVTTSVGSATLTFSDVTAGGIVTISPLDPASVNLAAPGQFSIAGATAFDISTTATTTGPTTVCFDLSSVTDPDGFAATRILHGEGGAWVDRTTSSNFATGRICATVTSLSPFVAARLSASYQVRTLFDTSRAFKVGSTVPIKVQVLDSSGRNVSSALVAASVKSLQRTSSSASAVVQDAGRANADRNFRYDAVLGGYIFNLSTKGLGPGTYRLTFTAAGDPGYHAVQFQLR